MARNVFRIYLVSISGGVGRSHLALSIAVRLSKQGYSAVVVELCGSTTTSIMQRRVVNGILPMIHCRSMEKARDALRVDDYDVVIIESRVWDWKSVHKLAHEADLILIPTGPTNRVHNQVHLADELSDGDAGKIFMVPVLTGCAGGPEIKKIQQKLKRAAYPYTSSVVPRMASIVRECNAGKTWEEVSKAAFRENARKLMDEICAALRRVNPTPFARLDLADA